MKKIITFVVAIFVAANLMATTVVITNTELAMESLEHATIQNIHFYTAGGNIDADGWYAGNYFEDFEISAPEGCVLTEIHIVCGDINYYDGIEEVEDGVLWTGNEQTAIFTLDAYSWSQIEITYESTISTDLEITTTNTTQKIFVNGQVRILKAASVYSIQGQLLK